MNIDTLDLNLLRIFDAVYREQSLSRAATRLGLSQPAISQAINRLRHVAGDPLFIRQAHGVTPTVYSDAIAGPIRQALDALHAALQMQTARDIRHTERRLRIAMSDYSESLILAPLVRIIDEQAPKLHLRVIPIDSVDLHAALQSGDVDLVVGAVPPLVEHFRHQDLFAEDFVCIVRRGHPAIQGHLSLEEFKNGRHVRVAIRSMQLTNVDETCLKYGFERRFHVIVPNFLSVFYIVAATDNIATSPRRLLRLAPTHLDLQVLPPPIEVPPPMIRQYWPERNHQDTVCQWVRGQIYKLCQAL
ncbi:MAG: LysR family transcriptional regulator [Burkholderiales bacterium]|nr:LysR family transcriptional regulator [Burkholderiales bacterium]